jgi:hypothetical protein
MNLAIPLLAAAAASAIPATPAHSSERRAACRDTITQVREQSGLPKLERGVSRPGKGLLIAAVDKRIDDCRVLVMARDTRDIRREPEPGDRKARWLPAR